MNSKLDIILKKYHEQKLSHAYLIETNDINRTIDELKEIIKEINCPNKYEKNCTEKCNICHLIKNDSYPSFKIINRDGLFIKKEQIENLQFYFSKNSQYGKYNFYVVNECQYLNSSSANSFLKFLEEPESLMVGFFVTDYKERVISTITSRCQVIKNNYEQVDIKEKLNLSLENYEAKTSIVSEIINYIENEKEDPILFDKTKLMKSCVEHKDVVDVFKMLLDVYNDAYKKKNELVNSNKYSEFSFLLNISSAILLEKIKIIKTKVLELDYNINIELLIDDFLIQMEETK